MSPMIVLDPTGWVRQPAAETRLQERLPDLNGKVVGIIDDGLAGSEEYLKGLERRLREEYPGLETRFWTKPLLSRPAPEDLLATAAECDAVVVGSAG